MFQGKYDLKVKRLYETRYGNGKRIDPYISLKKFDNNLRDGLYIYFEFPENSVRHGGVLSS
jgi:hypothetical protein